jgi:hypothetical protein
MNHGESLTSIGTWYAQAALPIAEISASAPALQEIIMGSGVVTMVSCALYNGFKVIHTFVSVYAASAPSLAFLLQVLDGAALLVVVAILNRFAVRHKCFFKKTHFKTVSTVLTSSNGTA